MTLALRYAVRSDVGLLREGNEDSAYAGPHLLAVADGMGGHAAGEVASSATITTMAALDTDQIGGDLAGALADSVANANMRLQELIIADPATEGMGTTLTAILWYGGHAALCHIGDSRAYLLRDGQFYQITHDHSLVQSLVDEGKITEEDIPTHPHRSLLLRALDGRTVAEPDLSVHETMPGDRYLLCSDGLSGVVTEQTLHQTLRSVPDLDKVTTQLVELAIKGGGPDNITCIVADVIEVQPSSAPPTRIPTFAGAAANVVPASSDTTPASGIPADLGGVPGGPGGPERPSSPATRAMHHLTRTKPQAALPPDEDDPSRAWQQDGNGYHPGYSGDEDADDYSGGFPADARRRRRWPIVSTVLVLLVLVVGGGLFAGWRYVQGQYYIGVTGGHVAIFRGVDQDVAGISLSSLVHQYPLKAAQLDSDSRAQVSQTISYGSLASAQSVARHLQQQATHCQQGYQALEKWQQENQQYQRKLAAYNKLSPAQKKKQHKPAAPAAEPTNPASEQCAPSTAFGIPASALPGQAGQSGQSGTNQKSSSPPPRKPA
ncbi:MAG: serine/threonine-protein phosphatase [Nocardiopsaceae bacterium]|nr:serine/threonine-protein phosphatase [Nocardiopsaceae bacterium]